mmetsp:Transcript_29388/g.25962  ORF Transcript_29388/g.25962 Transcript_29388/m.25962 type:complete len:278 (-) Transcript_29388:91-924(-)|eukprot:CAMPEP_0201592348 /NCGR_PEP_ID=MMETSP0190_2-20130828/190264_1 /ASSEMBLY_ACC=CAM_ASM_000263 /TAXON_ID=37353 /ORGANISM="Rosalina sp." /LENGTH=277 /DNA_ID=CAMNT_0048051075 /DNA_START=102 /DNA_END=935 /DNA_ORIENTATION=+
MPKQQSAAQKAKAKKGMKKKRQLDPFLKKDWYVVKVPTYMPNNQNSYRVGFSPATKGRARKALESRSFMINLGDLQNDEKKNQHDELNWKKFRFITEETFGDKLLTQWHGMQITRDKRCSLIRKWHSMIEAFCDAKTTDGYVLRVKALAFTKRQSTQIKKNCYAKTSQMRVIRARMRDIIKNHVSGTDLQGVVRKLSHSSIGNDIRKSCQLTFPLKVCLIEKVKVMRKPKKDVAKLMASHDLTTGFDPLEEKEENEDDENEDGDVEVDDNEAEEQES